LDTFHNKENLKMTTSSEMLWQALMASPNDIDRMTSWVKHEEHLAGAQGAKNALERAAMLSGCWLGKIWLTRFLLHEGLLDESLKLYQEALQCAPRKSFAVQEIGGHLGEAGYYQEIVDLLLPIYSPDDHGPWAGFNLLNACEDSRDFESAQEVLHRMKNARWPNDPSAPQFKRIVQIKQEKLDLVRRLNIEPGLSRLN
jgi:tetratricopeptide (TPR) repeat protein